MSIDEDALRAARGDPTARESVLEGSNCLIRSLARRFAGRATVDDLQQAGGIGVLRAIESFDPDRGAAFAAYATPFVIGEMLAAVRQESVVHVPRGRRQRAAAIEMAADQLTAELNRAPTVREIGEAAGLEDEAVVDAMRARKALAPPAGDPELMEIATAGPEFEEAEIRIGLGALLADLEPRSRAIVVMRFGLELSQTEIADRLGISQMHVSRLLRAALAQIGPALERPDA